MSYLCRVIEKNRSNGLEINRVWGLERRAVPVLLLLLSSYISYLPTRWLLRIRNPVLDSTGKGSGGALLFLFMFFFRAFFSFSRRLDHSSLSLGRRVHPSKDAVWIKSVGLWTPFYGLLGQYRYGLQQSNPTVRLWSSSSSRPLGPHSSSPRCSLLPHPCSAHSHSHLHPSPSNLS